MWLSVGNVSEHSEAGRVSLVEECLTLGASVYALSVKTKVTYLVVSCASALERTKLPG